MPFQWRIHWHTCKFINNGNNDDNNNNIKLTVTISNNYLYTEIPMAALKPMLPRPRGNKHFVKKCRLLINYQR